MQVGGGLGDAERFVLGAVRSFATGGSCPTPPRDERWADIARQAGVLSIVLDAAGGAGHPLPAALARTRYHGVATQLRAGAELAAVTGALGPTAARWVVLKGPVLADVVYRRPGVRTYTDLDVLVHPSDLGEALGALEAAGFDLVDRNWRLIADSGRGEINLTIPGGGLLDLHWHVVNDRWTRNQFALDVRSMVANRRTVQIDGLAVPSLDPVDALVHLALHAALSGGYRILWLLDLQQAVRRGGCVPGELAARATAMGVDLVVQVMLSRAAQYVDDGLEAWAAGRGSAAAWARLCRRVSLSAPPLGMGSDRRTGRLLFSSTRSSTGSSLRSAVRLVADEWLPLGRSMTLEDLHAVRGSSADRRRWLADAKASR